jgi:uncharacterized protein YcnI
MGLSSRFAKRGIFTVVTTALTGVIGMALCPGAWADVKITPLQALRGDSIQVTFQVSDTKGAAYTTKVQIEVPPQVTVSNIFAMSVPGWAPEMSYRTSTAPLPAGQTSPNMIPTGVTWERASKPSAGHPIDALPMSVGPLPNAAALPFTVIQTYSDHTVQRWGASAAGATSSGPGPVLKLTVAPAGVAAPPTEPATDGVGEGMAGMGAMMGMDNSAADPSAAQSPTVVQAGSPSAQSGGHSGLVGAFGAGLTGGVVLAALFGGYTITRNRRRRLSPVGAQNDDAPGTGVDDDDEPIAASAQKPDERAATHEEREVVQAGAGASKSST